MYNLVDDDSSSQTVWPPAFAESVGAPVSPHMSEAEVTAIGGEDAVYSRLPHRHDEAEWGLEM